MKTAKELVYKAYIANWTQPKDDPYPESEIRQRFENWWSEWYNRNEHKDSFQPEHNVYINGKRYIQAE